MASHILYNEIPVYSRGPPAAGVTIVYPALKSASWAATLTSTTGIGSRTCQAGEVDAEQHMSQSP
jgi:hypothetical protein